MSSKKNWTITETITLKCIIIDSQLFKKKKNYSKIIPIKIYRYDV